jgi:hypothetical protein
MSEEQPYTDADGTFEVSIPAGWEAEHDTEEGGLVVGAPDGVGLLHLVAFPQPPGEMPDPAEELYAFLEGQGIELEEDEVEDLELEGGAELSLCEYLSEDEDEVEGEVTYWLVAVATAPGVLVFGSYSCPAGEEEAEREAIRKALASLRLRAGS